MNSKWGSNLPPDLARQKIIHGGTSHFAERTDNVSPLDDLYRANLTY